MTHAQTLEKLMMEVIRVTRTVLGSVTRTGNYIVYLYSFSCDDSLASGAYEQLNVSIVFFVVRNTQSIHIYPAIRRRRNHGKS